MMFERQLGLWFFKRAALIALSGFLFIGSQTARSESLLSLTKQGLSMCEYDQWGVEGAAKVALLIENVRVLFNAQPSYQGLNRNLLQGSDLLKNDCTGRKPGIDASEAEMSSRTSAFRIDLTGLTLSACKTFIDSPGMRDLLGTRYGDSQSTGNIELLINGQSANAGDGSKLCLSQVIERPPFIHEFIEGKNVVSFITY